MRNFPIRYVHIKNFKCHNDLKVKLGNGVTTIVGPNGRGKSSFVEAIAWCLFGPSSVNATQERLIRKGSDKCSVEVHIYIDSEPYVVYREYSSSTGSSATMYLYDEVVASGSSGVVEYLRELGVDKEGYDLVYARQGELAFFINATPSIRKAIMTSLFRLDYLDRAISNIREDYTYFSDESITQLTKEEFDVVLSKINTLTKEKNKLSKELPKLENRLQEINGKISRSSEFYLEKTRSDLLKYRLEEVEHKISETYKNVLEIERQLLSIPEINESQKLKPVEAKIEQYKKLGAGLEKDISICLDKIDNELLCLENEECPTCHRKITDIDKRYFDASIKELDDSIRFARKDLDSIVDNIKELESKRGKIIEQDKNLLTQRNLSSELEKEKSKLLQLDGDRNKILLELKYVNNNEVEDVEKLVEESKNISVTLKEKEKKLVLLIRDINYLYDKRDEHLISLEESKKALRKAKKLEKLKKEFPKFRDVILSQSLQWVSSRASNLIQQATKADTQWVVEIDTDLNFWVNGIPLQDYSSGQIDLICVCIRIAIAEFLSNRVGIKDLLILDGVFDSIDENNLDVIGRLVSEIGIDQIIILSHFSVPVLSERELKF